MADTPVFGLPEISQSQSSKYITHNTALNMIEALIGPALSITNSGPPGSPSEGDVYIVDVASDGWAGADVNDIAHYYGSAWNFYAPFDGLMKYIVDDDELLVYTSAATVPAWTSLVAL